MAYIRHSATREACFTYFPQHWENSGQNPTPGKICKICERKAKKNKVPREIFLLRVFSLYLKTLLFSIATPLFQCVHKTLGKVNNAIFLYFPFFSCFCKGL